MYYGIYSGYSAPGSRIARMESRYSGMRIAPKQTLTCIIPIILIPDWSQTNAPLESRARATKSKAIRREGVWWRVAFTLLEILLKCYNGLQKFTCLLKNDRRTVETSDEGAVFCFFSTQLQQQVLNRSARVNSLLTFCTRSQPTVQHSP